MGSVFFKDVFKLNNGFSGVWLAILYIYGAYLRKYGNLLRKLSIKIDLLIYLCISILGVLTCNLMVLNSKGYSNGSVMYNKWNDWFAYNTPFAVIGAIFVFLAFLQIDIKNTSLRKVIIKLGALSFGTYLLQTNYIVYAWFNGLYQKFYYYNVFAMIGAILLIAFIWYAFGTVIDFIRDCIFKKVRLVERVMILINKVIKYLNAKFIEI
jgi:peptidoglycan/LPS O-acetylase OafA/YrhL